MALIKSVYIFFISETFAQVYKESKSQHRFAQSYLGINTQFIPAQRKAHEIG